MRLIDADALIEKYGEWYTEEGSEEGYIGTIKGLVNRMPTIEPERKKGKWIEFPIHMAYKCSECGRIILTTDGRRNVSKRYPFCHCGADMRTEE